MGLFGKVYGGYGCNGSWMEYSWKFLSEVGGVDVSKRNYTASLSQCQHQDADVIAKGNGYNRL